VTQASKEAVRAHWEVDPCGSRLADAEPGSREFFDQVEAERYRIEPFIPSFAEFERWRGTRVLEIGVGLGTDFVQFARAGAHVTGIDLTDAATALVRRRLELERLEGTVCTADAENLPFGDDSFDLVYSWGVLHHTPDTELALAEVRRVLAPGGEARIMLYSRRSWFALGVWGKTALLRGRPWLSFTDVLASHVESPGTKAYTQAELDELFQPFADVHYRRFLTSYDRRVAGPLTRIGGEHLGWFVGITACMSR
jgi:ubiquinone/menaquinone biosynthesis C-methylase UbiE